MMQKRKFYAILDIDHPMVAWEVAIGRILTTPLIDRNNIEYPTPSLWLYNRMYSASNSKQRDDLLCEFQIEKIRQEKYQNKLSRFSGAFFFESKTHALEAYRAWEWENKEDYISEIEFYSLDYIKLDSNWIIPIQSCQIKERTTLIEKYYNGIIYDKLEPIYEIISTGYGFVLNSELRRLAYKKIFRNHLDSTFLLAIAISCFEQDPRKYKELLRVSPYIYKNDNNEIIGQFIIDMQLFDDNQELIAKQSKRFINPAGTLLLTPKLNNLCKPLKIQRPLNKEILFSISNLSDKFFTMTKSEFDKAIC